MNPVSLKLVKAICRRPTGKGCSWKERSGRRRHGVACTVSILASCCLIEGFQDVTFCLEFVTSRAPKQGQLGGSTASENQHRLIGYRRRIIASHVR